MWTLDEALKTVRWLETKLRTVDFHVALTGSALFIGTSEKDLDVVVYPHGKGLKKQPSKEDAWAKICECLKPESQNSCKGTSQTRDDKDVRWIEKNGKRIDFFFLD